MVSMRFHLLNEYTGSERTFKVSAPTVGECIEIVNDEIKGTDITISDYYVI